MKKILCLLTSINFSFFTTSTLISCQTMEVSKINDDYYKLYEHISKGLESINDFQNDKEVLSKFEQLKNDYDPKINVYDDKSDYNVLKEDDLFISFNLSKNFEKINKKKAHISIKITKLVNNVYVWDESFMLNEDITINFNLSSFDLIANSVNLNDGILTLKNTIDPIHLKVSGYKNLANLKFLYQDSGGYEISDLIDGEKELYELDIKEKDDEIVFLGKNNLVFTQLRKITIIEETENYIGWVEILINMEYKTEYMLSHKLVEELSENAKEIGISNNPKKKFEIKGKGNASILFSGLKEDEFVIENIKSNYIRPEWVTETEFRLNFEFNDDSAHFIKKLVILPKNLAYRALVITVTN
ncbi:hypothetical protein SCHIN_v1c07110 [Spiroplasma chinense]|uniref:Lipoprotein n=1 Tax=Spiroplasma chinense TaxID=216932 RepID=A0A5B9Y5B6_9MOLU|nr:hypothetical protein [Spiroplasma chinense]QEH61906.1 hypothetical protein SCHIN_v1c07110 [Spiroplasma chinense]